MVLGDDGICLPELGSCAAAVQISPADAGPLDIVREQIVSNSPADVWGGAIPRATETAGLCRELCALMGARLVDRGWPAHWATISAITETAISAGPSAHNSEHRDQVVPRHPG